MAAISEKPAMHPSAPSVSPGVALLRDELRGGTMRILGAFPLGSHELTIYAGHDAIWAITRREGRGGIAMRAAFLPAGYSDARMIRPRAGEAARIAVESCLGK